MIYRAEQALPQLAFFVHFLKVTFHCPLDILGVGGETFVGEGNSSRSAKVLSRRPTDQADALTQELAH